MRSRETTDGLLRSQRNLTRYPVSARPAIIAFVKQKAAEFRAEGGRFVAPKMMRAFASFNAATKTINLSRSEMADAKLAALVEELIHFSRRKPQTCSGKKAAGFRGILCRNGRT